MPSAVEGQSLNHWTGSPGKFLALSGNSFLFKQSVLGTEATFLVRVILGFSVAMRLLLFLIILTYVTKVFHSNLLSKSLYNSQVN